MKRTNIGRAVLAAWCFGALSVINAQSVDWIKQIGGLYNEQVYSLCNDQEGNIYATGAVGWQNNVDGHALTVTGWRDIYLAKFAADGTYEWAVRAGGGVSPQDHNEGDWGLKVAYDSIANAIYLAGSYHGYSSPATFEPSPSVGGRGSFLAKYDLDGSCLWVRTTYNGLAHDLSFDEAGNVFVTGYSDYSYFMDSTRFLGPPQVTIANGPFAAKYSSAGDLLWARSLGTNVSGELFYRHGTLYFIGSLFEPTGSLLSEALTCPAEGAALLANLDSACATVNWMSQFNSDNTASFVEAHFDSEGDLVISGAFMDNLLLPDGTLTGATAGVYESFVAKFDSTGGQEWALGLPATATYDIESSVSPDNTIYVGLSFSGSLTADDQTVTADADRDIAVLRLTATGDVIGMVHAGAVSSGNGDLLATSDGGCAIAFPFDSTIDLGGGLTSTSGDDDVFVAKLGAITSVPQSMAQQGGGLLIYANPNNGVCTIELPEALRITQNLMLSVFDSKGRLVQQAPLTNGDKGLRLDIRAQAKGAYRVELGDGEQRYSGSIVFE